MKFLYFQILLLLFFSTTGISQTMTGVERKIESKPVNNPDSAVTVQNLNKLNWDGTQYNLFLRLWDRENYLPLNTSLTYAFRSPKFTREWGKIPSGSEILIKFGKLDFQGSTAYQFVYADEFYKTAVLKPDYGNAIIVPILPMAFLALYGAYEGVMTLKRDPPISFDEVDAQIMNIIRENPGLTAVDYYQKFSEKNLPRILTFMTLQQRLEKLKRQRVVYSRKEGDNKTRYTLLHTQEGLLQILDEELRNGESNRNLARIAELERMKKLLLHKRFE